ncbi:hypothetical protein KGQ24_00900 [Patescibacteria group bacterium]|nr:hypothetical protein [Patescibacteria group bacterium]
MHHPTRRGWKMALFAGLVVAAAMAMAPPANASSSTQTAAKKIGNQVFIENLAPPEAIRVAVNTAMTEKISTATLNVKKINIGNSTNLATMAVNINIRPSGSTSPPMPNKKSMNSGANNLLKAINTPNIVTVDYAIVNPSARRLAGRSLVV